MKGKGKTILVHTWTGLSVPEGCGSLISRQSAHEGGKVDNPTHRPPLLPGNIPGTYSVRGSVDPRTIFKNPFMFLHMLYW